MPKLKDHIDTITDLMLGAAYADKRLEGEESDAISNMLCHLLGVDELPDAQRARMRAFNPAKHDPIAAAKSLGPQISQDDRRKVLDLVASVNEADEEIDLDEDAYLRKVAKGLGVSDEELGDLALEILEEDDLDRFFEE